MLALVNTLVSARHISYDEALVIAEDFFNKTNTQTSQIRRGVQAIVDNTTYNAECASYYIFNASDNKGFVIVSGDDRLPKYLAYSKENTFDYENFIEQIPIYFININNMLKDSQKTAAFATSKSIMDNSVEPLLKTTWNQGTPYNNLTPILIDNTHCATGCTNTAIAQVMKYWQYPTSGVGVVSYDWRGTTLTQDLSLSHYQWDIMENNYEPYDHISEASCNAVATLMRDCGYANATDYSAESGASLNYSALVRNFGYDKAIKILGLGLGTNNHTELENAMRSELDAGRPILVAGRTSFGSTAHAYVCDGYDNNGFFHFNMGWGGTNDGYYLVSNGWIDHIEIGIQPDCGGEPTMTICSRKDFKYDDGKIKCELGFFNPLGIYNDPWGDIYNEVATICENIETHEMYAFTQRANTEFSVINEMPLPFDLPDGNYIIYPALRFKEGNWKRFSVNEELKLQREINLYVVNGVYTYKNDNLVDRLDEGKIEIDGIFYILNEDKTATVTCKNYKLESYKGNVVIPSSICVDGIDYKVTRIGEYAFAECDINELVIGENIKYIEPGFLECSIQTLKFVQPSSLEEILPWGFNACIVNDIIELPMGLKTIGECAFQTIHTARIDIPSSVDHIDSMAFNAATNLKAVCVHWKDESELPWLSPYDHIFSQCNLDEISLYVPKGTASIYANAPQWKDLKIEEYDESGVNEMNVDERDVMRIYNINGIKIPESKYNSLGSGLYIINGNKVLIR